MREFRGRTAVVTGAASGIGLALAERFAAEGMRVALADVEEQPLARAASGLKAQGAKVLAVPTDVSSASDVAALAQKTLDAFGAVHIVCNNAGVFTGGLSWEASLGAGHRGAYREHLLHGRRHDDSLRLHLSHEQARRARAERVPLP